MIASMIAFMTYVSFFYSHPTLQHWPRGLRIFLEIKFKSVAFRNFPLSGCCLHNTYCVIWRWFLHVSQFVRDSFFLSCKPVQAISAIFSEDFPLAKIGILWKIWVRLLELMSDSSAHFGPAYYARDACDDGAFFLPFPFIRLNHVCSTNPFLNYISSIYQLCQNSHQNINHSESSFAVKKSYSVTHGYYILLKLPRVGSVPFAMTPRTHERCGRAKAKNSYSFGWYERVSIDLSNFIECNVNMLAKQASKRSGSSVSAGRKDWCINMSIIHVFKFMRSSEMLPQNSVRINLIFNTLPHRLLTLIRPDVSTSRHL